MPAVASRSGGSGGRRRQAMNEINMVPFIDVMLVLLIIFMVTAPLITTGVVDVPTVGKSRQRPPSVVEVLVGADEKLRLRLDQGDPEPVTLPRLVARVRQLQKGNADVPVIISADRNIKYEAVMNVMAALQKEHIQRVGLTVKQGP
ncbi:MAG: biopolymer transporter ExbD [Rubrivivax sp.]|jgi:biopolymer transport protein TolR|nr:biopolymer transporter ExbD [Rubrivivax sp.]